MGALKNCYNVKKSSESQSLGASCKGAQKGEIGRALEGNTVLAWCLVLHAAFLHGMITVRGIRCRFLMERTGCQALKKAHLCPEIFVRTGWHSSKCLEKNSYSTWKIDILYEKNSCASLRFV